MPNERLKCRGYKPKLQGSRSIGDDKSLGIDGYNSLFFKKAWPVVKNDIVAAITNFFSSGKLYRAINCTSVTLIPKTPTPATVKEFRPIACCTILYKITGKILSTRVRARLCALFLILMMLMVAAILFCNHQQAVVAREVDVVVVDDGNELKNSLVDALCQYWPYLYPWPRPCPPPRPRPQPRPRPCAPSPRPPCSPSPPPPHSPPPPPPSPPPPTSCSASDKKEVKECMFSEEPIEECCPTFKSIISTSCPCYKYAWDLNDQWVKVIDSSSEFDSPRKDVQVIKPSKKE
ncbi:uncharacterized protein LOC132034695 [Lycium ferocissimum]|uniref:uncharacterized protein LOC132034695 n=1 Tax=Lycium ferocissimum TaxID=112874 RepID=UPI002815497D|nr:uncharacterized protein LOC132034695 [Lycium ferocissimum]